MTRDDFKYSYSSHGYRLAYKGYHIGGVNTLESRNKSLSNLKYYKEKAEKEIDLILAGRCKPYIKKIIDDVDGGII